MIPRDSYNFCEMLPVQSLVWWRSHMWSALKARVGGFNDMLCFTLGETIHFAKIFSSGLGIIPTNNFKGYQQRKFLGKQPVFRMWPTHAIVENSGAFPTDTIDPLTPRPHLAGQVEDRGGEMKEWKGSSQTRGFKSNQCGSSNCFFFGGGDSDQGYTLPGLGV